MSLGKKTSLPKSSQCVTQFEYVLNHTDGPKNIEFHVLVSIVKNTFESHLLYLLRQFSSRGQDQCLARHF